AVDMNRLIQQSLSNRADSMRREFQIEKVDGDITVDLDNNQIRVSIDDLEDVNIARDILDEFEVDLLAENIDDLGTGEVVLNYRDDTVNELRSSSLEAALKTVRRRVDSYGLTQPEVQRSGNDRIRVVIPGETNP